MMIAATYTQGDSLSVREMPRPKIAKDEILLRVAASSICGTDVRIIRNGHRKLAPGQRVVLGHEFAGVIESVGPDAEGAYAAGQRVGVAPNYGCGTCPMCVRGRANMCPDYEAFGINLDGAHAQFVRLPHRAVVQGNIVPLPDSIGWVEASLAEPLSCVINGVNNVRIGLGDSVLIIGAGPIGLMHLMLANVMGAAQVIVADTDAGRLLTAESLGAANVIATSGKALQDEVLRLTGGRGADVVVTACSVAAVQEQALAMLAPYGRLSLFGGLPAGQTVALDTNLIHYKNLVVTGSTGGTLADFITALRMIAAGRIDVRPLASQVFPGDQMSEAFEAAMAAQGLKIVIRHGD